MSETVIDCLTIETPTFVQFPNGKKYQLKKFSINIELKLSGYFNGIETWREKFQNYDGEAIIYALWLLLSDDGKKDFPKWENLADEVPADMVTKMEMAAAVSIQFSKAIPGATEAVQDALKKVKAQMPEAVKKVMEEANKKLNQIVKTE